MIFFKSQIHSIHHHHSFGIIDKIRWGKNIILIHIFHHHQDWSWKIIYYVSSSSKMFKHSGYFFFRGSLSKPKSNSFRNYYFSWSFPLDVNFSFSFSFSTFLSVSLFFHLRLVANFYIPLSSFSSFLEWSEEILMDWKRYMGLFFFLKLGLGSSKSQKSFS